MSHCCTSGLICTDQQSEICLSKPFSFHAPPIKSYFQVVNSISKFDTLYTLGMLPNFAHLSRLMNIVRGLKIKFITATSGPANQQQQKKY